MPPKRCSTTVLAKLPGRIGARAQFARIAKHEPSIAQSVSAFLGRAYELKSLADYGTGTEAAISLATTKAAIETAARFVDCIAGLIGGG